MNPLFHTDFSISDSLKSVRKSVLIYETIILSLHNNNYPCIDACNIANNSGVISVSSFSP